MWKRIRRRWCRGKVINDLPRMGTAPPGFGLRQPSGAFEALQSGRGLPQSKTLPRVARADLFHGPVWLARNCLLKILRQSNGKIGTSLRLACDGHLSVVSFHNGFDETQAEAKAAFGATLITAIKTGPDFILFAGRNADARVAEMRDGAIAGVLNGNGHGPVRGRVFDGIVQQVRE